MSVSEKQYFNRFWNWKSLVVQRRQKHRKRQVVDGKEAGKGKAKEYHLRERKDDIWKSRIFRIEWKITEFYMPVILIHKVIWYNLKPKISW